MARRPSDINENVYRKALQIIGDDLAEKLYDELGSERLSVYWLREMSFRDKVQKSLKNGTYKPEELAKDESVPILKVKRVFKSMVKIKTTKKVK